MGAQNGKISFPFPASGRHPHPLAQGCLLHLESTSLCFSVVMSALTLVIPLPVGTLVTMLDPPG